MIVQRNKDAALFKLSRTGRGLYKLQDVHDYSKELFLNRDTLLSEFKIALGESYNEGIEELIEVGR